MEFREIVTPVESAPPKVCPSVSCWSCSAGWVYSIVTGREEPGLAFLPVRRLLPRRSDDDDDAVLKKKEKNIPRDDVPGPRVWSFNVRSSLR